MDQECQDFLDAVAHTASLREFTIEEGMVLYRAQVGHAIDEHWQYDEGTQEGYLACEFIVPFDEGRLRPRTDRANEGRANPKGIAVFYAASDRDTAVAEVRPGVGEFVSFGQFTVNRPLRIVDCTSSRLGPLPVGKYLAYHYKQPSPKVRAKRVWSDIDEAFGEPVQRSDDAAEYVPTQVIAELFRRQGYDGLGYNSAVGEGQNVALFNLEAMTFLRSDIVRVTGIKIEVEESDGGRFI